MNAKLPDFVIIGAQKAASTLLQVWLRQHPDVWLPTHENPAFRDPVYSKSALRRLSEQYAGRVQHRLGMKCPDYLGRVEVPARLHADLVEPQLIVCLRNPIDRALSAYFWRMRWGLLPVAPANVGLQRILDGEYSGHDPTVGEVLNWSLYHQHLSRYLKYFPREKILILFDDDLRHSPEGVLTELHEFLSISSISLSMAPRAEANVGIYSLERLRFLQGCSKHMLLWDDAKTYASLRFPSNPVKLAKIYGIAGVDRYLLSRLHSNVKPVLPADLTHRLWRYYAADVGALATLVGRDLSSWSPLIDRPRSQRSTRPMDLAQIDQTSDRPENEL